jgi:hypothetical protein
VEGDHAGTTRVVSILLFDAPGRQALLAWEERRAATVVGQGHKLMSLCAAETDLTHAIKFDRAARLID